MKNTTNTTNTTNTKFPSIFSKKSDGGNNSGVTAYFLIEWKPVFSIALLKFQTCDRDKFHSHAFNAVTFWLKGSIIEHDYIRKVSKKYTPSFKPKFTPRNMAHNIEVNEIAYALTFRGKWNDKWLEYDKGGNCVVLTHGRKEIN